MSWKTSASNSNNNNNSNNDNKLTYVCNANGDVDMHRAVPQDKVDQLGDVHLGTHLLLSSYPLEMSHMWNNIDTRNLIGLPIERKLTMVVILSTNLVPARGGGWLRNQQH